MKKLYALLCLVIAVVVCSFSIQHLVPFEVPKGWPAPTYDFTKNPLTTEKIALGKKLFFEPLLSRDNTISCSSCHLPRTGFTHIDHQLSHGINNRIGTRNSLALVNLAWSKDFMWDGAVHHLDVQSLAPMTNHDEMDETIGNIVKKLQAQQPYPSLYAAAFGDSIVTGQHTMQALSQFMLTLVSKDSKYDKVMRHEPGVDFTYYEGKGYQVFKANCASCHQEPLFTNYEFENNGLPVDTTLNDIGRAKVTHKAQDIGRFKVPTLRNIEVTYPYMHDGRFRNLQMVVFHYTNGVENSNTLSPQLQKKIVLDENDKFNLIAFLRTLTDETFLHNPQNNFTP